ncbi:MAG TPA: hypothetical protein VFS52_18995 [Steroidobacteraceae bacterium]|nr:hypothetical protein [Steroidobacteraceae bacterium]
MGVTYYFGDAAGRAFHSSAAWLEIVLAFGGFFAVDYLLGLTRATPPSPAAETVA